MKDLITTIASLLILMIFILQFSGNQVTHHRRFQADMAVESFRDTLKEQGYITEENQSGITAELARICGCGEDMITVEGSSNRKERGSLLHYRIRYPLQNLIVMGTFLGIEPEDNMVWAEQKGWV